MISTKQQVLSVILALLVAVGSLFIPVTSVVAGIMTSISYWIFVGIMSLFNRRKKKTVDNGIPTPEKLEKLYSIEREKRVNEATAYVVGKLNDFYKTHDPQKNSCKIYAPKIVLDKPEELKETIDRITAIGWFVDVEVEDTRRYSYSDDKVTYLIIKPFLETKEK